MSRRKIIFIIIIITIIMSQQCRAKTQSGTRCQRLVSSGYFCPHHSAGSRYISEQTRTVVYQQGAGSCFYCRKSIVFVNRSSGRGVWEPDHLRPHSQGGANTAQNLVAACRDCNRSRSDKGVREFGNGDRPRCQGFNSDGNRCNLKTADGKNKFCHHHAK